MKLAAIVLTSALVPTAAALAAPAAAADANLFGNYTFAAEDGESATWSLAPCPEDSPGCVRVAEFGNSKRAPWSGEAHAAVGSWILFVEQPDAILCDDGTSVPGRNTYSWDSTSLAGSVSIITHGACGAKPASLSIPFRLTKTGSPVQYPTAPVDTGPLAPAAPPAPAAPVGPVGALPAESSAGEVAIPVIPPTGQQLTEAEIAQPGDAGR